MRMVHIYPAGAPHTQLVAMLRVLCTHRARTMHSPRVRLPYQTALPDCATTLTTRTGPQALNACYVAMAMLLLLLMPATLYAANRLTLALTQTQTLTPTLTPTQTLT